MTHQLRSELLKMRTTRTLALLVLGAAGLALLGASIEGLSRTTAKLAQEDAQRRMFGAVTTGVFFATLGGLLIVTSEFRYGTIRPTLLFEPRRRVVLGAKLTAATLAGILIAVVCVAVSFGAGLAILAARGVDLQLTESHVLTLTLGAAGASALSAMVGVAVGSLVRNQVGAIVAVVAYAFVVDAGLFAAIPSVGRYLPGKAGDALAGLPTEHLLIPGLGAAVLLAWTLAFIAAATVRSDRSDV